MKSKIKLIILSTTIFIGINALVFLMVNRSNLLDKETEVLKRPNEEINILMIQPDYFNPLISKNKYIQETANLVFEGLTSPDSILKSQPQLAKLLITSDNLKWEVTLRDDVFFHNGEKFTADDVIFTINKIKSLNENSYYMYNVQNIKSVEKISDYKILIELNDYDNFFPDKLTFPILLKRYYEKSDLFKENGYVGTGPYKVLKQDDQEICLEYNEKYYNKSYGNIKNINVKIASKTRPSFEFLKLGEIDIADTDTEVGAYGRSAYNSKKYITSVFEGINFGEDNEILKDNVLRQSILLGINRDNIINKCVDGYGNYADIPVNLNSYLHYDFASKYAFNPERAQDLLINSGWKLKNGIFEKNGNKLEFTLLMNSDTKKSDIKSELIRDDLGKIGIKINIILKPMAEYNYLVSSKQYDLAVTDWAITEYPEFLYNFETSSPNNSFGFSDEDYDYLVYLAKREILEGKQKEYFNEMQNILIDRLPMIGLYFETSTVYYTKDFKDDLEPKINNIYDKIEEKIVERKVD